jgi:cytochrome c
VSLLAILLVWVSCAFAAQKKPVPPTKAEVVAFVEKAVAYVKANGKEKALKEFGDPKGEFIKGELYLYAYDLKGVCLAHATMPDRVGKEFANEKDSKGYAVMQECLRIMAAKDRGWFRFHWLNPATGKIEPKLGYIMKMDNSWFLGSGTYGAEASGAAPE